MSERWHEGVASAAGVEPSAVEAILRKRNIRTKVGARPARKLRITSLTFSGEKRGKATGHFNFSWQNLENGVWAVTSDGTNLVGKSTVLEVILWSLRGDIKSLQSDVKKWLEHVTTDFTLDGQKHAVDFRVEKGVPVGTLSRTLPSGDVEMIDSFETHVGFRAAMSRFMMEALDLDPIPYQRGKDETATVSEHGWSALSGGLYFGGEHQFLLGETQFGGLPGRILQLYVGLPWASTVMQASTALKELTTEDQRAKAVQQAAVQKSAQTRGQIEADLASARNRLSTLAGDADFAARVNGLAEAVVKATTSYNEVERRLVEAEDEAQQFRNVADADERESRGIRETFVAASFFNGLQPTCCPRCETSVTNERIMREQTDFSCSVCAEPIPSEKMEDVNQRLTEANERATATRAASNRAAAVVAELKGLLQVERERMLQARSALGAAPASSGLRTRRDIELEIAKLEGMLEAHSDSAATPEPAPDRPVVSAAHDFAKQAMDDAAQNLLAALDKEVLNLAQRFGFVSLESVKIDAQARMEIGKGGATTIFGDLTKGERLRLRLATAIALLRIGRTLGVGRHPGLLIIDSPGAEETEDSNLEALLHELRKIADDEVGIQVIVSSAKASEVVALLNPDNCKVARKGKYLW
ncbi:hypothetical protein [Hyphomicrobium sp. CS1BSMeth3]|uniref:hypothetical protein n=1 Tax=Hyphomicrobium sp. CS1BSMeth3 TaxID=1892844 RepID=UPI000930E9CB|nr:hypothetical protein [Hyphomicrobium sp. CS1BSMeth3]